MKLNDAGYKLITEFEGLSLKPYYDSVRVATIGYGSTFYPDGKRVLITDPTITKEQAYSMFKGIADKFALKVFALLKRPVNQNQFNALVSFAYNVGVDALAHSTLLHKVNLNPNDPTISTEFAKWNKANRQVLKGLTTRRKKESDLYFTK